MKLSINVKLFLPMVFFVIWNMVSLPAAFNDFEIISLSTEHNMFYTIYSGGIFFSILALIAMCIVDFEKLKKKDYYVATLFSLITLAPILISASSASISFAVAVFFGYLASITLESTSSHKVPIFSSTDFKAILVDISLAISLTILYLLMDIDTIITAFQTGAIQITPISIIWPLAASVSEEVIFRMFLFYVVIKLNRNERVPFFLMILILTVPFAIWHRIDHMLHGGIIYAVNGAISFYFTGIILSIIALKRNLFVAILIHFLINFLGNIVVL